jgi:hypothetical protein
MEGDQDLWQLFMGIPLSVPTVISTSGKWSNFSTTAAERQESVSPEKVFVAKETILNPGFASRTRSASHLAPFPVPSPAIPLPPYPAISLSPIPHHVPPLTICLP